MLLPCQAACGGAISVGCGGLLLDGVAPQSVRGLPVFGYHCFEELWHNFANLRNFVDFLPFSVDKALVLRLFQSLLLYLGV